MSEDKQKILAEIADKTAQMQKLFDECFKLAKEHNVEFSAGLNVPKELSPYNDETYVGGSFTPPEDEDDRGRWYWENSSLNC